MKKKEDKFVWTATVGEKGQIVIPKQARDLYAIRPGDTLILVGDRDRGIAIPPKDALAGALNVFYDSHK
ncbi:MAG: AbrB/MazE/SpoVT family DNA-binding domain-containing protein [Lachnospiraceae bacterium]|nr:AbrB/MazE/SpoVT family DNA-binding domain-containing protein [Lachnospiraceae bacterium]